MKVIIHDLNESQLNDLLTIDENTVVISDDKSIKPCIGCFGCWIKTPGECVIKDKYQQMGQLFSTCEELIIISKCFYGGYSPFVKNVLDRSISYVQPSFIIRNNEMHHKQRYDNRYKLTVWFYGESLSEQEVETARNIVAGNAVNFEASKTNVYFVDKIDYIKDWRG